MSRQNNIVLKLREMVLSGALRPGERVAEIPVAATLGVSRTPVRFALGVLSREGLVVPSDNGRGFVVREFTLKDVQDAIKLRGVLEGMAARLLAERGVSPALENELRACLAEGERVVDKGRLVEGDGVAWATLNERFHDLIVEGAENRPLGQALRINDQVPFASAGAFLDDAADALLTRRQYNILLMAQMQHTHIVAALVNQESARVEALMREHSYAAFDNIVLFRSAMPPLVSEGPAAEG
jgi:GntR family transcriptional regulator, vanillate catabolism transcriptional regulator